MSPEYRAELMRERRAAGATLAQIGSEFGVSRQRVCQILGHRTLSYSPGQHQKIVAAYKDGGTLVQIARLYHTSRRRVVHALRGAGATLRRSGRQPKCLPHPKEQREMTALYENGASLEEVAASYQTSRRQVMRVLRAANVTVRRPGPARNRPSGVLSEPAWGRR